MKISLFLLLILLPLISCGSVVSPESSSIINSDSKNKVITVSSHPTLNVKNEPPLAGELKKYLIVDNSGSYEKFVSLFNKTKPNVHELKIAQLILELRKKENINDIKSLLPKLLPLVKHNQVYSFYLPWINQLQLLTEMKLYSERIEHCYTRWEKNEVVVFENHLDVVCHQSMKDYLFAKGGKFPEEWDIKKTWTFLNRKPVFYFSNSENVSLVKKALTHLTPEQQTYIMTNFSALVLPNELSPHSSLSQLISSHSPNGGVTMLDLNARKQQRREISQELTAIYATGGHEVDTNYYDNVTNDLIQTTLKGKLLLGDEYIAPRLIVFSDFLTRNSRQELSRKILEHVKENFAISSTDLTELHFNYIWSYLTLQDYGSAIKYAESNSLTKNFDSLDSKLQYWIAHSYHSNDNITKGIEYFKALVNINPITYYSIMAMKNIKAHDEDSYKKIIVENFQSKSEYLSPLKNWSEIFKSNFVRLAGWIKLGSYSMISQEYNFLLEAIEKNIEDYNEKEKLIARTQILHGTAILFNSNSSYLSTFRFIGQAIQKHQIHIDYNFILTLFPSPYQNLIKNNSYDVDHILLSGLMRQESGFDPRAKSAVGATGLMQLMPYTARMVDRSIATNLTNPENNTSIGIRYLKKLLDKYNNNMVFSLAAYNAGDHRVNSWMKTYFKHESILYNIESIPYAETRNYVKLIFRNMFFYKFVEEQDIKDTQSFNQLFNIRLGFNI